MMTHKEAIEGLKQITFRLDLGKNKWGTGFFISEKYALTAFHNVEGFKKSYTGYIGQTEYTFKVLLNVSLRQGSGDIAVLERQSGTPPATFLPLGYLDPKSLGGGTGGPPKSADDFWRGMPMSIFGFPVLADHVHDQGFDGNIQLKEPYHIAHTVKVPNGGTANWLSIYVPANNFPVKGISGAPVVDLETGRIVAVQHSADNNFYDDCIRHGDRYLLWGSEVGKLVEHLKNPKSNGTKVLADLQDLFKPLPFRHRGPFLPYRESALKSWEGQYQDAETPQSR